VLNALCGLGKRSRRLRRRFAARAYVGPAPDVVDLLGGVLVASLGCREPRVRAAAERGAGCCGKFSAVLDVAGFAALYGVCETGNGNGPSST